MDVVSGKKALEETIWKDPGTNIAFLPAGSDTSFFPSTSEILASGAAKTIFDKQ